MIRRYSASHPNRNRDTTNHRTEAVTVRTIGTTDNPAIQPGIFLGWDWGNNLPDPPLDSKTTIKEGDHMTLDITCPNCGRYVRQGFYPLINIRCERCWTVFSQDEPAAQVTIIEPLGFVCACGELLAKQPEPGNLYFCLACGRWQCRPGDQAAGKQLRRKRVHPARGIASAV